MNEKLTLQQLMNKIEEVRFSLYEKLSEGKEINEEETSRISHLLDKLINEFYKVNKKNKL